MTVDSLRKEYAGRAIICKDAGKYLIAMLGNGKVLNSPNIGGLKRKLDVFLGEVKEINPRPNYQEILSRPRPKFK